MKFNPHVRFLLIILLFIDFFFSFLQYYNTPLYGDLEGGILPTPDLQEILQDPFGIRTISSGEKHLNPNRYFSHVMLMNYFQHVPVFLQKFVDPITSVYLASAFLKFLVQILFILIMTGFVSGTWKVFSQKFLRVAVVIAPLFQVYGYWSRMGIVDKSVAYTFFYGLPLVLTMAFLFPFFNFIIRKRRISRYALFGLIPLSVILPFSGPLVPAVILIVSGLIYLDHLFSEGISLKKIPAELICLIPICLLSLYSLFLGRYDSNYAKETIPVMQRFFQLPVGIKEQLFHSLGFPLLLITIGINVYLVRKNKEILNGSQILRTLKWVALFSVVYILLLPFGGYRPYRPYIIRYDTFMPVNIALFYCFAASGWTLISNLRGRFRQRYLIFLIPVLGIFFFSDLGGINQNVREKRALEILATSPNTIVQLPDNCTIMSWGKVRDYRHSELKAKLLYFWNITDRKKLFYQKSQAKQQH